MPTPNQTDQTKQLADIASQLDAMCRIFAAIADTDQAATKIVGTPQYHAKYHRGLLGACARQIREGRLNLK